MATWDDVARICLALPATTEVTSRGNRRWRVRDELFAWERPLRPRDLEELGSAAPRCRVPPRACEWWGAVGSFEHAPRALVVEHLPLSSGDDGGLPSQNRTEGARP